LPAHTGENEMNRKIAIIFTLTLSVLLAACMQPVPSNLNTATTRKTDQGLFELSYKPALDPIEINEIHTWTLHVATNDGQPVIDAQVNVDGGMPQHGHGLPTKPVVTENLGNGDYLIEGMKFQMTGWWEVKIDITANGQHDKVTFNLILK
jgi:hypothetical protein